MHSYGHIKYKDFVRSTNFVLNNDDTIDKSHCSVHKCTYKLHALDRGWEREKREGERERERDLHIVGLHWNGKQQYTKFKIKVKKNPEKK